MKLKMHASQMHSDIMFACIICQKEFKGKRNLARQMPSCCQRCEWQQGQGGRRLQLRDLSEEL